MTSTETAWSAGDGTGTPRPHPAPPATEAAPGPVSTKILDLDQIVPYWRNPRVVTEDAVTAVADSINRYGYLQPIMVDTANVIILGHTRYAALRRLGWTEALVQVADNLSAEAVKALRVIDNRTHEYASWNFENLTAELADLDRDTLAGYFPEASIDADAGEAAAATAAALAASEAVDTRVEFVCSTCFHTWDMPVTREAIFTGRLEVPDGEQGEREDSHDSGDGDGERADRDDDADRVDQAVLA